MKQKVQFVRIGSPTHTNVGVGDVTMEQITEKFANADKILSNITSFLLKEGDAPCSAETHLNTALFGAIELMNEEELNIVFDNGGQGFDSVIEIASYRYGSKIPLRYQKFFSSLR